MVFVVIGVESQQPIYFIKAVIGLVGAMVVAVVIIVAVVISVAGSEVEAVVIVAVEVVDPDGPRRSMIHYALPSTRVLGWAARVVVAVVAGVVHPQPLSNISLGLPTYFRRHM